MTDQDANAVELPQGSLYVTGFSPSGICGGTYFYDRPFTERGARDLNSVVLQHREKAAWIVRTMSLNRLGK
jgi:hypothetical protein